MKAVIVNSFDTYEDRVDLVHEFLKNKGYDVTVIQSDFRHFKKIYRKEKKEDFIFVRSNSYYKNMSIARLTAHYKYASDAFKIVEEINPDLLYVFIPPNSLAKFSAKYKMKHKEAKLIFDLIDLWPETMPIGKAKKFLPFTFWRRMRDKSLKYADFVITECDLYKTVLGNILEDIKVKTIYLAKKDINVVSKPMINEDEIHLCYLGSINNIIDIPKIKAIIKAINEIKPTTLHIIGDGERKEVFINEVESVGAKVEYYGKIYNVQEKQDIFDRCHLGLNIMKESVCVGLTMKSIDYFQHGLPILNNIQADTTEIVDRYRTGFNINDVNVDVVASMVTSFDINKLLILKENTNRLFICLFSINAFNEKLEEIIKEL